MKPQKLGTQTSTFGVSQRVNHDSSKFYDSKLYADLKTAKNEEIYEEYPIPERYLNTIICHSSEAMKELHNKSIHLMITSPPYNVGKDYDKDLSLTEYLELIRTVMKETYRVLVPGGRVAFNVANIGRKPYLPLDSYIMNIMEDIGFLMRGQIIWDKSASSGVSFAWGSYKSASNPVLRDVHEYILIFSKGTYSRQKNSKKDSISGDEFREYTKSIWSFPAASARKIGHPAPFPEELPSRLIKLYSFEDDVILDPFIGSGTTGIAALKLKRNFIGYEVDKNYCNLAKKRISEVVNQTKL